LRYLLAFATYTGEVMSSEYWVLVVTHAQRENWAAENLQNLGYGYYLPKHRRYRRANGKTLLSWAPVFPRYLFVHVKDRWRSLTGAWGIQSVIMRGNHPEVVPDKIIEALRAREDPEGFFILDEHKEKEPELKPGQKVRITDGPFQGSTGLYVGQSQRDRQRILMSVLGRESVVTVNSTDIATA
jgi:transcriptional antiterminator RfaH